MGFIQPLRPSLQFSLVAQLCPTLCDPMDCSTPQTHVHWVGDAIQPSHPLSSPSPPAFNLSQNQGLFKWVSSSHQVAKVLEFQLQHQSFQCIFRTDWFPLLVVQETLKSLLQHHNSKASILQRSAFFIVQHSHPYMTTEKTGALTRQTFVGKVMSLVFNMLSRLAIAFLPRSKCLLISWLQLPSAVILEPKESIHFKIIHVKVSIAKDNSAPIFHSNSGKSPRSLPFGLYSPQEDFSQNLLTIEIISWLWYSTSRMFKMPPAIL